MNPTVTAAQLAVAAGLIIIATRNPIAWIAAPVFVVVFGAGLIGATMWASELRERCGRYQAALRRHGIDPDTARDDRAGERP